MLPSLDTTTLLNTYRKKAKRYDFYHGFVTMGSDQKGRKLLIENSVFPGNKVLDAGGGTGTTALMAAVRAGASGHVTLLDLSGYMIEIGKKKAEAEGIRNVDFIEGDMYHIPFGDEHFDVVLSTYSTCPLGDPEKGTLEMYRTLKKGGLIGVAHSTEPNNKLMRWIARKFEKFIWHFPSISLGCRAVEVLPALEKAGAEKIFDKKIGVPLYPFRILVFKKPSN